MATYLDIDRWPRRDAYDYFRHFDKPFFNVCTRLDVSALKAALPAGDGLSMACYFIALRLANLHQPFRLRLEGERVRVYEEVHGSTTVLREDGESFGFADFEHRQDYASFIADALPNVRAARSARGKLEPKTDDAARIHCTTLPWIHFTSFSHARNWGGDDSVPKFAFGRADSDGDRLWLPMSVEVHHALMDGVHVGRYVQAFEAALREPQIWLANPPAAVGGGRPATA
jgi:chloramphenicol O-acetyltransferase type A